MRNSSRLSFLILLFLTFFCLFCGAQNIGNTIISGTVKDAVTKAPLPYVTVSLENTFAGTISDTTGNYRIVTDATSYKINFSFVGYKSESKLITPGNQQIVHVELVPKNQELGEVTVLAEKRKYRNKNNPAVDLIERVINNKHKNRMADLDYYSCKKYEKLVFSFNNVEGDFKPPRYFNEFQFVFDNIDSTDINGHKRIPMYIKESLADFYFRKNPKATKEFIQTEKAIEFEEYYDNRGLSESFKYLYQDIHIYDDEIFLFSNKFLSPVANTATIFYKYYIIDTLKVDQTQSIQLFFEPRNPADFLFHGFLFITNDSVAAIKKIDMSFNKGINIDWIKDVRIIQEFEDAGYKNWMLSKDLVSANFALSQRLTGVFGQKETFYGDYSIGEKIDDQTFGGPEKVNLSKKNNELVDWDTLRLSPLTNSEKYLYKAADSVKQMPAFRRKMNMVMLLTTQLYNVGKFEIGPVGTFLSFSEIEGTRLKFGGRTTPEFNRWIYLDSYLAYGFKDDKFKYRVGVTYSLKGTSIYKFPVKALKLLYQYETQTPGQILEFGSKDNFFLSFKRGIDDKIFYNKTLNFEYLNEFENHFSFKIGYNYTKLAAGGNLFFTLSDDIPQTNTIPYITISEAYVGLRFAPNEKFYEGKQYRAVLPSVSPVFQFRSAFGFEFLESYYTYQKFQFRTTKRFYVSIVGYTDLAFEVGKIFGQVSYPVMFIHNANQTYSYQKYSYNMMNFLEFVSDQYVALNIDHSFNGFIFNKIPLLKKLKFREVVSLKMLYGGITDQNDPAQNPNLLRFPADNNGVPLTYTLEDKPHIEGSIGISNILRVFRVDLIKRFNYLDNPNVTSLGFRVQFVLDF